MIHYGDVCNIDGAKIPKVDIITFGAPCQDLSVAGKRAGMKSALMGDEETTRSGLFFEAIRIIKEMREDDRKNGKSEIRPRYAVYENVPGAFSSNKGEDFRAVLEETAKVADENAVIPEPPKGKWTHAGCIVGDGWSIAWRVHDAQFWGVPQRRKRICLLADFDGETAGKILFKLWRETKHRNAEQTVTDFGAKSRSEVQSVGEGVLGNTTESRKEGEGAAADVRSGIEETGRAISFQERAGKPGGGKGILIQNERTGALSTLNNQSVCCLNDQGGSQMGISEDVSGTLRAEEHGHQPVVYGISAYESNAMKSDNPNSGIYEAETARTLDLNGGSPACNQGGMAVVSMATKQLSQNVGDNVAMPICANDYKEPQVVCVEGNGSRPSHRGDGYSESETMYTLNTIEKHAVCVENHPNDSRCKIREDGMVQTLSSRMGTGGGNVPMVMEQKTYQDVTGSLCASGYDKLGTQEAMNDMFVVQNGTSWDGSQVSPTLTANNAGGSQRMPDKDNFNAVISYGLDRASFNQGANAKYNFSIEEEKIGAQVARGPGAVCTKGDNNAETRNQILRLLQETYGAETILKWGVAVLDALQQTEILQQRVHEGGVQSEAKNGEELDGSTLPCPSVVAEWLLRDMRQREECGYSPQGRKSTEQRFEQSDESMPELSQQNPQTCKEMFDMWEKGEGLWLLQQALYQIQKIWKSVNGQRQSVYGCSIVRRLTPLEAERLQGFPIVRKVRFTEMTKDEYIAWNLAEQHIIADVNAGKVYVTRGPGGIKLKTPRELNGSNVNGYLAVSIRNGDTKMQCRIHRIIWIAAHGIIPDGYVVDHINNNKMDNRLENLQLLTAGENSTKARNDGLYKVHDKAGQAKISDEVHDFIQYMYDTTDLTCKQLAEIFGISKSRVHQIIHDESWTDIGDWVDSKGKKHKGQADSPRYKALGNSLALPFWCGLAKRIVAVMKKDKPTMGSLFSGIGGFELAFARAGCKPVWNSEIESFPEAVTTYHFGDEKKGIKGDYEKYL